MPPPADAAFLVPAAAAAPPAPAPMRFGEFVITETGAFPPPAGPACWVYVTLNAEISMSLPHNRGLRHLLGQARLRTSIDGQWLLWALQRKYPERALRKLSGSDLIFTIARHCAARGQRLLLLGSSDAVNERAVQALRQAAPGLHVCGVAPPFYAGDPIGEATAHDTMQRAIEAARPDYIVLGLGADKEHRLAQVLAPRLDGRVTGLLCFGGAIDIAGGAYRRAPKAWQLAGIEGLYRVWQDPSRLLRLLRVLRILPRLLLVRY